MTEEPTSRRWRQSGPATTVTATTRPSLSASWLVVILLLVSCLFPGVVHSQDVAPVLLSKKEATTGLTATNQDSSLLLSPQQQQPNNIMTDQIMSEAVDLWCTNPTLATKYFGHISQWNTSAVTNFRGLFRRRTQFNDDISQWDTSKVTSMAAAFEDCTLLNQDLSRWDTSRVLSMSAMFSGAMSFTGTYNGSSLKDWNVEQVARMDRMFQNAILFHGDLSGWRTTSLHHVAHMFTNAINYVGGTTLQNWYTTEFRDMTGMFQHAIRFDANISYWDTRNAIEMDEMFHNAIAFSHDISRWDTSKVVTMARMFRNATKFTGLGKKGGIRQWNVEKVSNFYGMFEDNPSFISNLDMWEVTNAKNMERMFYHATAFGTEHLTQTISETTSQSSSEFKLLCWNLPNAQVKTLDMFCGSSVRFDPCCASPTQFQTSCCNRFCYNTTDMCHHPAHDQGAANAQQYSAQSASVYHPSEEEEEVYFNPTPPGVHIRGVNNDADAEHTSLGWEGSVMIVVLLVVVMVCFWGMVKFL